MQIVMRPLAARPKHFKRGARVAFLAADRRVYTGTFWATYTPAPRAGSRYVVNLDNGDTAELFYNGPAGRSLTVLKEE